VCARELHNGKFNSVGELYSAIKRLYDKHGDAEFVNTVEFYGSVMIRVSNNPSISVIEREGFVWE